MSLFHGGNTANYGSERPASSFRTRRSYKTWQISHTSPCQAFGCLIAIPTQYEVTAGEQEHDLHLQELFNCNYELDYNRPATVKRAGMRKSFSAVTRLQLMSGTSPSTVYSKRKIVQRNMPKNSSRSGSTAAIQKSRTVK